MRTIANISRLIVGLVFVFSGFVKGVDPLGTAYRIEDYFIAYGMDWANPLALFLSIFLCALEFALGVYLLLNIRLKLMSWPLLLLMVYFFILTFFDALNNPVPDCGCFGDAIKLTNWETFYKNIVLIILVAIIFYYRKKFRPWLTASAGNLAVLIIFSGIVLFSVYQYRHLPLIDFLGWKTGTDLVPDNPGTAKVYLLYRNKATGEEKEYLSSNYPWNDTIWMKEWEFVNQRVDESGVIKGHSLRIFDSEGNDLTEVYVNNPDYQFLLVSYDLSDGSRKGFEKLDQLYGEIAGIGYSFVVLTGSLDEEIAEYRKGLNDNLEFYHADDIELKMMVRANPGMILLKDGIVLGKWHWRDAPDFGELKERFPDL